MTSPVAGTIRYTVGTNYNNSWYNFPSNTSTAYTGPFAITQSSVISARLFDASGNPLGNPVTRGFYLITPKTHYKYFFTGTSPAADFEKGTPIVSSVMGQMVGDAPHEDVRFGDNEHRTVYSGALNITTAGAYTFSASYGGAITIDRVPLADGTPVSLAAGEHIFKIVTPASGLDTPYTYSGPGASAGSDLNNLLKTLNTCSQVFPATHGFGTRSLSLGATEQKEITIVNRSVSADLTIASIQLTGANPGEFLISADSGETVLAPGAERIVAVRFNPATVGSKTASLHVVAANLPGGFADSSLTGTAVVGTLPATPASPSPANAASGVTVNPTLDWADVAGATSYDVYLWLASASKPATATATVSASQWTPPILTDGVNYNWQVVAINSNGSTSGPVWAFHTGTSTVQFSNLVDGQVLRYSMVMIDGTFDGGATLTITAAPVTAGVSFTKYGTRFRCLVDLRPGTNTLTVTDGNGPVALNLVFTPPTATDYRFKVWYVVPSDEANSPVDPDWLVHFSLQTKLMQSWMAEDQMRAGNGRLTFYPELDAASNVSVEKLVVSQTRAQATAIGSGMYGEVFNQIPAAYKNGLHKNLAFSSVAFNALGSGDLCYVGAYSTTGFHPASATEMMTKLLSTQLGNDNALTYSTYCGVTLHETIHCLHNIWHDTSPYHIMGGGGYDISQYFTLTYSESNTAPHGESSAGTLGKQRDIAAWNRYLMSADPRVYNNTTVAVTAGPEYLTATSANPLAVFQYYIPENSADLHTKLAAVPVTTYSKHAGLARQELGASPFNVMAVDTEGNMSYNTFSGAVPVVPVADSYTVSAGASIIAAPGVLANDINPSASTLSAALVTNVLHGTLVLNSNGGFTYTPTTNYAGTDTFTYRAIDGVSSDQQAVVTLTVTAVQITAPTTPMPANGATGVAVNTALDWADVAGATNYDVFLWVTAQTKPATATANVTSSSYVPPATLVGATGYSWQVVAKNQDGSVAGPTWTFATAAQASDPTGLIGVDLTYSDLTVKTPYSGDTTLSGTLNKNAVGLIFTGQTGAWNGVNVGGNNANNNRVSVSALKNGAGGATAISFSMGTATSSGSGGGDWRNTFLGTSGGNLREEQAYLYNGVITGDHFDWEFSGLTPNAHYQLVAFASAGALSNVANGVAGSQDAEGDWNWADVTATAAGRITGRYIDNSPTTTPGIYGFQLYKQATSSALAANAGADQASASATIGGSPAASGGTAPYSYSWSPSAGLSSATAANPTATPATTTIYTLTVTDFLGATATDSMIVSVGGSTVTTLTSSPVATGPYGTAVDFIATVTPAAPGSVVFKDGSTTLATIALASGQATFTATGLAVGSHSITASYGGSGTFTASNSAAYDYTVTAKPLTITGVTAANKVYDGNATAVLTGGAVSGVIAGETVTVASGSGAYSSPNAGTWPVMATGYGLGGASAGNYSLSSQPIVPDATIAARPLQLAGTRAYDGTTTAAAGVLTVANNLDAANLTLTGSVTLAGKNAGAQGIVTGFATPVQVANTVGAVAGSGAATFNVTITAPASGNTLIAVIATRSATTSAVSDITNSGSALNWQRAAQSTTSSSTTTTEIWYAPVIAGAGTTLTIGLSGTIFAAAVVGEYSGVLNGGALDVFSGNSNSSNSTAASTGTTASTTQANELWIGGIGARNSTYTLTSLTNSFSNITSTASGSGTAGSNAKVFALEKIVTSIGTAASGGTISSSSRWSGAIATFKAASALNLVLAGSAAANYTLTGATGTVQVTPKALTVTGLAASGRPYNGTAAVTLSGAAALQAAEASGAGSSADGKPHIGDTLTLGGTAAATFPTKHIGELKPVAVSGITLGGAQAGNYTLTQPAGLTATVTALPVTVSAVSATKTYDGTTSASGTPNLTPALFSGDSATILSQAYQDPDAGSGNRILVPSITINDGNGGANYAVTLANFNSGTIDPAPATISLGSLAQTYDGSPKSATATTNPPAKAVAISYNISGTAPTAAGSYAVVADIIESNFTGTSSGTLVISPAAATVTLGNLEFSFDGLAKTVSVTTDPAGLPVSVTYDGSTNEPVAAGTYAVVTSVIDPNYTGTAGGTMTIRQDALVSWRASHFTQEEIAAGLAADNADPEGDGFTNIAEYTLGTDPRAFSPQPLAMTAEAGNQFTLSFLARSATGSGYEGLVRKYDLQHSADLSNPNSWQGVPGHTDIIGGGEGVTITLPAGGPKEFYRLFVRVE